MEESRSPDDGVEKAALEVYKRTPCGAAIQWRGREGVYPGPYQRGRERVCFALPRIVFGFCLQLIP